MVIQATRCCVYVPLSPCKIGSERQNMEYSHISGTQQNRNKEKIKLARSAFSVTSFFPLKKLKLKHHSLVYFFLPFKSSIF
jgi:hypothetical protein